MAIRNLLKKIKKNWDYKIIHSHAAYPDSFAVSLIKDLDCKIVTTVHSGDLYEANEGHPYSSFIKKGLLNSDVVIAVSNKIKLLISGLVFNKDVQVIPNGINLEQHKSNLPQEIQKKINHKIVITTVGALNFKKGHQYVIEALRILVKKYPNIIYLVVGGGLEKDNLNKKVRDLSLENYVFFTGVLPHKEVLAILDKSDIFILPSWDEGFGIVYLEAMLSGKPVIGSKGEGVDDIIEDGKDGLLVNPKSAKEIVSALNMLIKDSVLRSSIGKKGQKKVQETFLLSIQADKIIKLYQKLINKT